MSDRSGWARLPLLGLTGTLLSILGGCVSLLPGADAPPLHLYAIVADPPLDPILPPRNPARVRLRLLDVDSLVQRTEILVRSQEVPSHVRYLSTDRWADFPAVLVTECFREHFNASRGIGVVLAHNSREAFDATLFGRILRFEAEEDAEGDWTASVVVDLRLKMKEGGESSMERLSVKIPCESPSPENLAQAMSAAIREAAAQAVPQLRIALQDVDVAPSLPFESQKERGEGRPRS